MHNARFRLMAGLAGATLCLFAVSANSQTPTTTPAPTSTAGTTTPDAQGTGTAGTATTGTTDPNAAVTAQQTTVPTDNGTTVTGTTTDATTTTSTTRSFPGGFWGIIAVAVIVLLILFSLFRGKDRTVVRETYASSTNTVPVNRNVSTGTAVGDRTLNPRTASGTESETNRGSGTGDPNTRL